MPTNRIEAFSDGVIAIIITIMVLELKVPHEPSLRGVLEQTPMYVSYGVSFLIIAIMWVNHHQMMHAAKHSDARLLWGNNNLLFWMSLVPFTTAFVGEHHTAALPAALYGGVFAMCAIGFLLLRSVLIRQHAHDPERVRYHRRIWRKNAVSFAFYASAVPLAFVSPWISYAIYLGIAASYFLPERVATGEKLAH